MMTTSGSRAPAAAGMRRVRRALLARPASGATADVVAHLQRMLAIIGSPAYPSDPARQHDRLQAMRAARLERRPARCGNSLAMVADGDRSRAAAAHQRAHARRSTARPTR